MNYEPAFSADDGGAASGRAMLPPEQVVPTGGEQQTTSADTVLGLIPKAVSSWRSFKPCEVSGVWSEGLGKEGGKMVSRRHACIACRVG